MIPLILSFRFMSNNMIVETLECPLTRSFPMVNVFRWNRQLSYIYHSTPLSGKNFTNSIYIIRDDNTVFSYLYFK